MKTDNTPHNSSPEGEMLNKKIDLIEEKIEIVERSVRQDVRRELYTLMSKWGSVFSILLALIGYFGVEKYVNWKVDQVTINKYKEITEEQTRFMKRVALQFQLKEIKNNTDKGNYKLEEAKTLVHEAMETEDKGLLKECLDELFGITLLLGKYEFMEELRREHENESELFKPRTFANIAIANMYLYGESKNESSKTIALGACQKALEKVPSYGEPQAVKLVIYMIDYNKQKDNSAKLELKENALQLLEDIVTDIKTSTQKRTVYETYTALVRHESNTILNDYVSMLFLHYPQQMQEMEDIYLAYAKNI